MPLRAPSFALGLVLPSLVACTSSRVSTPLAEASAVCPASLSEAIGVPCAPEGLTCSPEYFCGILPATATCTCLAGVFSCNDVVGNSLDDGGSARCPAPLAQAACPSSETQARLLACNESGLTCAYPSTCTGSQKYDQCECSPGGESTGGQVILRFNCPAPCNYDAAPVDDGPSDDAKVTDGQADDGSRDGPAPDALDASRG